MYKSPTTGNMGILDFDCSRSVRVKCNGAIGLPSFGFLQIFNSNMWPNSTPWRDIRPQNLSDLDFDLSSLLNFKPYNPIYKIPHLYHSIYE